MASDRDYGVYIGYSADPHRRLIEHNNGDVDATRHRRPVRLIYLEGYIDQEQALAREKNLKKFGSSYAGLMKRIGRTNERGGLV